jgi:transposase
MDTPPSIPDSDSLDNGLSSDECASDQNGEDHHITVNEVDFGVDGLGTLVLQALQPLKARDHLRDRWFMSKPHLWKRDLIRRPWIFPIAAMHLAAIAIQNAWRPCWLRTAKPSAGRERSMRQNEQERVLEKLKNKFLGKSTLDRRMSWSPEEKDARCKYVSDVLQERYLNLLKRQCEKAAVQLDAEAAKLTTYPSYEHFAAAILQGFVRHRRTADMAILWRIIKYKRVGLYHVAAFEIQSAWRQTMQRWENNLLAQEKLTKQGLHHIVHARVFAAIRIQQIWRKTNNYRIYCALRDLILQFRGMGDPYLLLRSILPREAMLLDPAMQVHLRFRLGGVKFPPSIYYKIFTHGAVCDLGAFAPRNYAAERLGVPRRPEDMYVREENNGWRPLITRLQPGGDPNHHDEIERTTSKKIATNFHYSRVRRRQDVERQRKQRSIAWMRKLYTQACDDQHDHHTLAETDTHAPTSLQHSRATTPTPSDSVAAGAPSAMGGAARLKSIRILKEGQMTPQPPPQPPPPGRPSVAARRSTRSTVNSNTEKVVHGGSQDLLEELPDDMLLEWSKKLDFDAYMDTWGAMATSDCSEGTLPIGNLALHTQTSEKEMCIHRAPLYTMIGRVH